MVGVCRGAVPVDGRRPMQSRACGRSAPAHGATSVDGWRPHAGLCLWMVGARLRDRPPLGPYMPGGLGGASMGAPIPLPQTFDHLPLLMRNRAAHGVLMDPPKVSMNAGSLRRSLVFLTMLFVT